MPPVEVFVFDTETHRMRLGVTLPRAVSVAWTRFGVDDDPDTSPVHLAAVGDGVVAVREALSDPDVLVVGANVAFDFGVLLRRFDDMAPIVWGAYTESRVTDTLVRDKLLVGAMDDLGNPKHRFSLADCVERRLGMTIDGKKRGAHETQDTWRLRYGELDGVPVDRWPEEAVRYAKDDVRWTARLWARQRDIQRERTRGDVIPDEYAQARADWWLTLMGAWGIRTDPEAVLSLKQDMDAKLADLRTSLRASGYVRARPVKGRLNYSRDMAAIRGLVAEAYGGAPPRTAKGAVSTKREHLAEATHAHRLPQAKQDALGMLQEYTWYEKQSTTYVSALLRGTSLPLQPNWNVLVATGRTSCRRPNLQNPPRGGRVRECFVARPGTVFVQADYSYLELCTLAQACFDLFGTSELREAINAGLDPHLDLAAYILGIGYDEARARHRQGDPDVADKRQMSKAANFGLPGGLGPTTWIVWARQTYGVTMTPSEARQMIALWKRKWRTVALFLRYIGWRSDRGKRGRFDVVQPRSGRVRAGCSFTNGANTHFQGLAADGAKHAGFLISRECYDRFAWARDPSPLFGSRPVIFAHDEFILETPERDDYNAPLQRLQDVMVQGMRVYVPDVTIRTEGAVMRRWYKAAKECRDAAGRVVPWEPDAPSTDPR